MGPPTEQLIRDYLNRLSVAARDRMSPEERRALVERTRKLIERRTDAAGRPSTLDVGKVLARLGSPADLVEREVRRLPAVRGRSPVQVAEPGDPAESGNRGFLSWVLRRDQGGRDRQPGWPADWRRTASPAAQAAPAGSAGSAAPGGPAGSAAPADPSEPTVSASSDPGVTLTDSVAPGADAGPQAAALADDTGLDPRPRRAHSAPAHGGDDPAVPAAPAAPADAGPFSARPQQAATNGVHNGSTGPACTRPLLKPQWPSAVARDGSHDYGSHDQGSHDQGSHDQASDQDADDGLPVLNGRVVGSRAAGGAAPSQPEQPGGEPVSDTVGVATSWQVGAPAAQRLGVATRRLLTRVATWAGERPLEAAAVILLGLGGAIYPPVFLLGAAVAVGSRLWDYRDKWVGLGLPMVLTVIGLATGIAIGGQHHGLHDGWVFLNIVSRIAALLGAGYLAWRSTHVRRKASAPPWNKPHRLG